MKRQPMSHPGQLSLFQEETVTVTWAAQYLGVSVMTVLRYRESGLIHGYQMSERGWWRILKESILEYEKNLRSQAHPDEGRNRK
ncbi:MAG TPA: helix-turn-helix domain-containing protein [Candidatus Angelobacter sp.]|nr:helix-turn-helix domain-containing protein [Candidatus Angelobacter sp.]